MRPGFLRHALVATSLGLLIAAFGGDAALLLADNITFTGGGGISGPSGGGTLNTVVKFTPTGAAIGNSTIVDDGTTVLVGPTTALAPGRDNTFAVTTNFYTQGLYVNGVYPHISTLVSGGRTIIAFIEAAGNLYVNSCNDAACTAKTSTTAAAYNASESVFLMDGGDGVPLVFYKTAASTLSVRRCTTALCTGLSAAQTVSASWSSSMFNGVFVPSDGSIAIMGGISNSVNDQYIRCLNPMSNCTSVSALQSFTSGANCTTLACTGNSMPFALSGGLYPIAMLTQGNQGVVAYLACDNLDCTTRTITAGALSGANNDIAGVGGGGAVGLDGQVYFAIGSRGSGVKYMYLIRCGAGKCTSATEVSQPSITTGTGGTNTAIFPLPSGRLAQVFTSPNEGSPKDSIYYQECLTSTCSSRTGFFLIPTGTNTYLKNGVDYVTIANTLPDGNMVIWVQTGPSSEKWVMSTTTGSPTVGGIDFGCLACGPGGIPLLWGDAFFGGDISARNITATGYSRAPIVEVGQVGISTGITRLNGAVAGTVSLKAADTAGTWNWTVPTTAGTSNYFLQTNGLGVTTWAQSNVTATNCTDSAGAAACGSAAAGAVVIDAGATTVVVSTTAVHTASRIFPQFDSSLGTELGVTCNATVAIPWISARAANTSFTISIPAAPVTNPACLAFFIEN